MTPRISPLLAVENLSVDFPTEFGTTRAVDRVSYGIGPGDAVGVVGESGCGKTVAALATLRLVPPPGRISGGKILFEERELLALGEGEMEKIRGDRVAMIFQEPATALNPAFTVGDQIAEVLQTHRDTPPQAALEAAVELLDQVGIPAPHQRVHDYPHNLSGGMRQRVMIAMALACRPALLIADEPTTALDVTIQFQILDLLSKLREQLGMAIQFISHNLAVVAEIADEVLVMYAGRVVERAPSTVLFRHPLHPYTKGLLKTIPRLDQRSRRLAIIPGVVPEERPRGCAFLDRCSVKVPRCARAEPQLETVDKGHATACFVVNASP